MHTPGSNDYQLTDVTYLDILRQAELRGLDAIAFTDHNTVNGYKSMMREIEQLEMLEKLGRSTPEENRQLADYHRLLDKILVLPGFEFTATFGFHILGLFPPDTPIRQLEHILLSLNIPPSTLDEGSSIVGASSDVLTAYRTINEAGGIVIAAHVNSAHGVAMRGFDFGGQTKIAYTQDPYLHALEVTDLDRRGPGATARFFDGTKSEYSRRMRCVQGSDAHRLNTDPANPKHLGIGDRPTEIQLEEVTFDAIKEVFQSADFARTRAYRGPTVEVYDYVQLAREKGASETVVFHESAVNRTAIVNDICALSNTSGGIVYIGCSGDPVEPPVGCDNLSRTIEQIRGELLGKVTPKINAHFEPVESSGRIIIKIDIPKGEDQPYAVEDSKIYVRIGAQTIVAGRDQIVRLVAAARAVNVSPVVMTNQTSPGRHRQTSQVPIQPPPVAAAPIPVPATMSNPAPQPQPSRPRVERPERPQRDPVERAAPRPQNANGRPGSRPPAPPRGNNSSNNGEIGAGAGGSGRSQLPRATPFNAPPPSQPILSMMPPDDLDDDMALPASVTPRQAREPVGAGGAPSSGVEIIGTETRKGVQYHVMRNLQNGQTIPNVTRQSARHLWQYAIIQKETNPVEPYALNWKGAVALVRRYRRNGTIRFDLAMRDPNSPSVLRVFYGVTDEGLSGTFLQFASDEYPIEEDGRV